MNPSELLQSLAALGLYPPATAPDNSSVLPRIDAVEGGVAAAQAALLTTGETIAAVSAVASGAKLAVDNLTGTVAHQSEVMQAQEGMLLTKADLVNGKVPYEQLPEFPVGRKINVTTTAARLALPVYADLTIAYQGDTGDAWGLDANADPSVPANWSKLGNAQGIGVASFNGRTGNIGPQVGDYSANLIAETVDKRFVSTAQMDLWNSAPNATLIDTKIAAQKTADDLVYVTKASRGAANGLAPLDATGKIPAANLPAQVAPDLSSLIPLSQKNASNGVAPLDADRHVPSANLPAYLPQKAREWRNVLATNAYNAYIPNASGNDMTVHLRGAGNTAPSRYFNVNVRKIGTTATFNFRSAAFTAAGDRWIQLTFDVPAGWEYSVILVAGTPLTKAGIETWYEMS